MVSSSTGRGQSCLLRNGLDHDQNACALVTAETKKRQSLAEGTTRVIANCKLTLASSVHIQVFSIIQMGHNALQ